MTNTAHRQFAIDAGVRAEIYDAMNAEHAEYCAKVRALRRTYEEASTQEDREAAASALDSFLAK